MTKLHMLLPLVTMPQAMSYELRAGWLPLWLPEHWLIVYYDRKMRRKYRRYLRTLSSADRHFLNKLNRELLPPTPCAKSPDP